MRHVMTALGHLADAMTALSRAGLATTCADRKEHLTVATFRLAVAASFIAKAHDADDQEGGGRIS
jgi:hypothetical protein